MPVETLQSILQHVYKTHPGIRSARSDVKSAKETVRQASANFKPTASIGATAITQITEPSSFGTPTNDQQNLNFTIAQPLYRGGRTVSAVKAAEKRIEAAEYEFNAAVQDIFLGTAQAYIGVLRDQEILSLRQNNEKVLETELEAAKARFDLGDVTKTDVSQAGSRYSQAVAERVEAEANYTASQAEFERVTGKLPDGLSKPAGLPPQEDTLDAMVAIAQQDHPDIALNQALEQAATLDGREIFGELLPELSLTGSLNRSFNPTFENQAFTDNSRLTLDATLPLYAGGAVLSRRKQSRLEAQQRRFDVQDLKRDIKGSVIREWQNLQSAKAQVKARKAQVEASDLAFEGVSQEARFGSRTTLDILDAEQERLNARVELVSAQYDVILAQYSLMEAAGQLSPALLGVK